MAVLDYVIINLLPAKVARVISLIAYKAIALASIGQFHKIIKFGIGVTFEMHHLLV